CHAIMDKYQLVPLSAYGKPYAPPAGKVDPAIDTKTPVRDQVNRMDAVTYFTLLAKLMKDNPPAKEDGPILEKIAKIGIVPGKDLAPPTLPAVPAQTTPEPAQKKIMAHFKPAATGLNGWIFTPKTGIYGTDYPQRALITAVGLGATRPEDAVYPPSEAAADGK